MLADGLNHGNGAKDAEKGPEDGHQVARLLRLRLAVSKPVRHGVRDVLPWRRRDEGVEEPVNVEVPAVVDRHDGDGGCDSDLLSRDSTRFDFVVAVLANEGKQPM